MNLQTFRTFVNICNSAAHRQKNGSDTTQRHTLPFSLIQEILQTLVQLLKHEEVMSTVGEVNDAVVAGAVPSQFIHLVIEDIDLGQGYQSPALQGQNPSMFSVLPVTRQVGESFTR